MKQTKAYRRYLIKWTLTDECFVETDKTLICWARDEADAMRKIDSLYHSELNY